MVASVVRRHGGRVEAALGDSTIAVFGLARSHGDDAVQAVDAALEMRHVADWRAAGAPPAIRIGVATADSVHEPADLAPTHPASVVSAASRLARRAAPGDVLVDAATRERSCGLRSPALATRDARRLSTAARTHTACSSRRLPPRSGLRLETPLVGRDRELAMLNESLARAVDEQTCVLFSLVAPAGAGKSRLIHEFVAGDPAVGAGAARTVPATRPGRRVRAARRTVARGRDLHEPAAPDNDLAAWMRKELADEPEAAAAEHAAAAVGASDAQTTAEDAAWALRSLFEHLAVRKPLVLVVDDTQWADPALLDFLSFVAGTSRDAPILLVCIARPELLELRPDWGGGLAVGHVGPAATLGH